MEHENPDIKSPGGLNNTMIALVGVISVLLFAVLFIATETWFYNENRRVVQERWEWGNPQMEAYLAEQGRLLQDVRNVPGKDDKVTVPIDWAIQRYAADMKESDAP